MPRRAHLGLLLALVTLAVALTGCGSDAVHVDNFPTSAAGHERCQGLLGALPQKVADQPRRRTSGSTFAAAWGRPAIVLRCGYSAKPEDYDQFAACQRADGVDWYVPERIMEDQTADVVMTTIGRSPVVQVEVPFDYRPATAPMVDLARAIKAHTRVVSSCS